MDKTKLKEDYRLAACCSPSPPSPIVGYYSHDNLIKIHRTDCPNIGDIESERLIHLQWDEVLENKTPFQPDAVYDELNETDFAVLKHHLDYGVDYSLVVARKLNIEKGDAFERHQKLRDMNLLERVEPKIIRYRKGIVDNKWIKHRNHTYYQLTNRGRDYIAYFLENN